MQRKDKSDDHSTVDVNGPTAREKFQWRKRAVMTTKLLSFDKDADGVMAMVMMMTMVMMLMALKMQRSEGWQDEGNGRKGSEPLS